MFKFDKPKVDETAEQLKELQTSIAKLEKKIKTLEKDKTELAKTVATQNNIVQVLDSGVFLSVYSLLEGGMVKFPKVKTPDDVIKTGVSENIGEMMDIINKVNATVAEKETKEEKKSKK